MEKETKNEPAVSLARSGETGERKLVLVGNPNVGKSKIFSMLTGQYVIVSNYPGTTVEVGGHARDRQRRPAKR